MEQTIKRSYYAVIPANVRYDDRLPMGARFLYGEITALCNERGYCWAGNKYFADLYKVTDRTIRTWISSLITNGYIVSDLVYREDSKEVEARYLKVTESTPGKKFPDPMEKNFRTPGKNFPDPPEKKFLDNNTTTNTLEYTTISKDIVVGQQQPTETAKTKRFTKPTIEEIEKYCVERKNGVNATKFFNYYEANCWKVGKNSMKNWKAAVRTWEQNNYDKGGSNNATNSTNTQTDRFDRKNGWF